MPQPIRITTGRVIAGAAIAGTAALAYASLVERHLFMLRHVTIPPMNATAGRGTGARPLRILHLSDPHITPGQHSKIRWIQRLAETEPDLVIATGDNLGSVDAVPAALRALGPLLALPGAFVFGSNDYRASVFKSPFSYFNRNRPYVQGVSLPTEELRDALTGAGWADCNNARATLRISDQIVEFVGVDDPHIGRDVYPAGEPTTRTQGSGIRIGLLHSPEPRALDTMADDGCSLILAGHTHGGQVRVPMYGALVSNCGLSPHLARGLHRWGGQPGVHLHVSAGLGTHPTAPIRFACPPEATILTLSTR